MHSPGCIATVLGASLLLGPAAFGQEDESSLPQPRINDEIEEIVVTGSRIKRSTYTSVAPLQILDVEASKEIGQIHAATILQESIATAGLQDELADGPGYVVPGGPGAATISLRGLGDVRTLVLVNGRRLAPAGVEGAPATADLNLVPSSMVAQYDLLLDGASSIYGSDAVAGVANIILRRDFDGFEAEVYAGIPQQHGGTESTVNVAWGKDSSRGFIGFGAEYQNNQPVRFEDRRWTSQCERNVEIDQNGRIRKYDEGLTYWQNQPRSQCKIFPLAASIILEDFTLYTGGIDPGPSVVYFTPGQTNTGIPGWSDTQWFFGHGLDGDGDGQQDVDYLDYSLNPAIGRAYMFPDFERLSAIAYGEVTTDTSLALTPYFELQYGQRESVSYGGSYLFLFDVPADNPYNPCNPAGVNGVDCVVAWNDFWKQQTVIDIFTNELGVPPSAWGLDANQPVGPIGVRTRSSLSEDRSLTYADVEQVRGVLGVRGELENVSSSGDGSWEFDLALVYSESIGESSRPGIRQDWLLESLNTSVIHPVTGEVVCGTDSDGDGIPDGIASDGRPCVPVNLFAPSLFSNVEGSFATQQERDFLFDTRDFETRYQQWFVTGYVSGKLFDLPAGPVNAVFGAEHREDKLRSIPDEIARDRLFFNFFADSGAAGEKHTSELFAELELPLLADLPAAQLLTVNASGRYTRDEFFGSHTTYAAKLGWRPHESLLLRATTGTSFRAPSLRENFFVGTRGVAWFFDPCGIPSEAIGFNNGYDPALDPREPHVLENCLRQGIDPTSFNLGGWNVYLGEYEQGGSRDVVPETSDAYSYGFVWDQPIFDSFDLTIGATYYNIDVSDTIILTRPAYFINACYNDVGLDSILCDQVIRDPITGLITMVDADFINRDELKISGYDFNISFAKDLTLFDRPFDLSVDLVANHPTENSERYVDEEGAFDYDDEAGRWGYPDWHGTATMRVGSGNYRFTWRTRYIGSVKADPDGRDPWSDIYEGYSDTCFGPTDGDVLCRDVDFADSYITHSVSLYWRGSDWTVGAGVRNLLDESPPLIDGSEVPSFRNTPLGLGYDANGRVYFFNVQARFD